MRALALAAAAVLAAIPAGSASAGPPPGVVLTTSFHPVALDHGHVVEIVCEATADPTAPEQVPVATEVSCSLDGARWRKALPGAESYVLATAAMSGPQTFCIWGEASFTDALTGRLLTAEAAPQCQELSF